MLTLTRSKNESIKIGDDITIVIRETKNHQVRLSIEAPKDVAILRDDAIVKRQTT